jgi:hypothetical protein
MQVKTESFMEAIKARGLSDLWSSLRAGECCEEVLKKKGAAGGGAGRSWAWGDGGAYARRFWVAPEHMSRMPGGCAGVDRPRVQFERVRRYLRSSSRHFRWGIEWPEYE